MIKASKKVASWSSCLFFFPIEFCMCCFLQDVDWFLQGRTATGLVKQLSRDFMWQIFDFLLGEPAAAAPPCHISYMYMYVVRQSASQRPRRFHTSLPLQCKNFFCGLKFTMTSAFEKLNDPEEPHDSFSRHISFSRVVKQGGGPPAPKRKYEPAAPLGRAGKPEKLLSVQTLWNGSCTFHLPKLVFKLVLLFYNSLLAAIYFHMIRPYTQNMFVFRFKIWQQQFSDIIANKTDIFY